MTESCRALPIESKWHLDRSITASTITPSASDCSPLEGFSFWPSRSQRRKIDRKLKYRRPEVKPLYEIRERSCSGPVRPTFGALRLDLSAVICSSLENSSLLAVMTVSTRFYSIVKNHDIWRLHVLQNFGVYYDEYMHMNHHTSWHDLYTYIQKVHYAVDHQLHVERRWPNLLRPCVGTGAPNKRLYRGCVETADNCKLFFWDNGQQVQVVDTDGNIRREIDCGRPFKRYFHRLANLENKLFIAQDDHIRVYDICDPSAEPRALPNPPEWILSTSYSETGQSGPLKPGRPLELLVHKKRLILFESNALYLWNTDDLSYIASIFHPAPHGHGVPQMEVQWLGDELASWNRNCYSTIKIWNLDGETLTELQADFYVQVDVARITWEDVRNLTHFLLAAMSESGEVSIYDSDGYVRIFRFTSLAFNPFDLIITQDFLATVDDCQLTGDIEVTFWKLWFHKGFETATSDPKWENSEVHLQENMGLLDKIKQISTLSVIDLDTYFASYRNYYNICSFHKNGQESLHVYRSNSLKKRMTFPPAKHTKFEEWVALQVDDSGTVVLYDFRPDGLAFDATRAEIRWLRFTEQLRRKTTEKKRYPHCRRRKSLASITNLPERRKVISTHEFL